MVGNLVFFDLAGLRGNAEDRSFEGFVSQFDSIVGLGLVLFIQKGYAALGIAMLIPVPLMIAVSVLTLAMCLSASIVSIRKVRTLDPVMVFRA